MKACPSCAEKDLQDDAKICKHCGKKIGGNSGFASILGVVFVIMGFFYWLLWILAALCFIVNSVTK